MIIVLALCHVLHFGFPTTNDIIRCCYINIAFMGCLYRDLIAENYISHNNNQDYALSTRLALPPTSLHTHSLSFAPKAKYSL